MAFLFSLASSFTIGVIDGYTPNCVDNKLYYGSAAITSGFGLIKALAEQSPSQFRPTPTLIGILGISIVTGATMLNASYMGKAIKSAHMPFILRPALSLPSSLHIDA
jgi:hypothetical protein